MPAWLVAGHAPFCGKSAAGALCVIFLEEVAKWPMQHRHQSGVAPIATSSLQNFFATRRKLALRAKEAQLKREHGASPMIAPRVLKVAAASASLFFPKRQAADGTALVSDSRAECRSSGASVSAHTCRILHPWIRMARLRCPSKDHCTDVGRPMMKLRSTRPYGEIRKLA